MAIFAIIVLLSSFLGFTYKVVSRQTFDIGDVIVMIFAIAVLLNL